MDGGKMFLRYVLPATLAVALGFAACQNYVFMEENKSQSATQKDFIPIESISKSDILFMVDNSGSMASKQQNLADNFNAFIGEVVKGQNDFHIGIVTSDINFDPLQKCDKDIQCQLLLHSDSYKCVTALTDGVAIKTGQKYCTSECTTDADCPVSYDLGNCDPTKEICTPAMCGEILGMDPAKKYCVPMNNGRLRACKGSLCTNYVPAPGAPSHQKIMTDKLRKQIGDDNFQAMFKDNVHVGTKGSGTEKGLSALKFALDPAFVDPLSGKDLITHENAGFFRPDAKLTVIVVSDEEDCSYDPVACPECSLVELYATRCYPDPNICHQDCAPSAPFDDGTGTLKCNTGYVMVQAQKETDMVRKGSYYCLKTCTSVDQCPKSSDLPPPACGSIDGFDAATSYCSCQYDAPVTNSDSVFNKLVPPADYSTFFRSLKPLNNERVNMAVIVGAEKNDANAGTEPPANCVSPASGVACAGNRYYGVASQLSRFFSDSICRVSFKDTLVKIVQFLVVSNEQELSDKPLDPSCVQVKINGVIIPRCGSQTDPKDFISCRTSQADAGGGDVKPCPEAAWLCGPDDRCADQNDTSAIKKECGCGDLSNTDKNCLCSKTMLPCKRINYWQYVPETCPDSNGKPSVLINGCGLAAGDKLEVNFLRGDSTTGGPIKCE